MLAPLHAQASRNDYAIAFARAPEVAPGDAITSTQLSRLARAFNDRLRSGVADPTYRIRFYLLSLFRQIRNPDASGWLWPAQHEFFTAYQMRDPDLYAWPVTGPGEPEGINVTNPLGAYVFGNDTLGVSDEQHRLAAMPWSLDGVAPATAADFWELGKRQRGAFDAASGALGSPALDAARGWFLIRYSRFSPHGNAYGGWLPTPTVLAACEDPDPDDEYPPVINYEIKFTATTLDADTSSLSGTISTNSDGYSVVTYDGTCQPAIIDTYPTHIAAIAMTPWYYVVLLNDGTLDYLPTNDWLEGPYTGAAALQKTANDGLQRIMQRFVSEYRGSAQQTAFEGQTVPSRWNSLAFDIQRFMTTQYRLAPARGLIIAEDSIEPVYPVATISAPAASPYVVADGTYGTWTGGGTAYPINTLCVGAAVLVRSTDLYESCTVGLYNGTTLISSVQLNATTGTTAVQRWFTTPVAAAESLSVKMITPVAFTSASGKIEVELAELLDYKPDISDLFMVARVSGALANA